MLFQILITIGASQALALSILLLLKRQRHIKDHLLSMTLMLMFGIIMLFNYREELLATRLPLCLHSFTLAYLVLPVFYQYIRAATIDQCPGITRGTLPHFIPFLLVAVLMAVNYLPMPWEEQILLLDTIYKGSGPLWFQFVYFGLFFFMFPFYLWRSLRELQKHEEYLLTRFSYTENVSLGWLNRFVWAVAIVWIGFVVFEVIGGQVLDDPISGLGMNMAFLVFVGCISALGIYGLRYQTIFVDPAELVSEKPMVPIDASIAEGPQPDPQETVRQLQHLRRIMDEQKPHLQARLTLQDLAEICEMAPHQLSRLINDSLDQHFFDFINGYRVQTFQKLVVDPGKQSFTLLALAHEAGFNSKSTFNAIFKKVTGTTPSAYARKVRSSDGFEPVTS